MPYSEHHISCPIYQYSLTVSINPLFPSGIGWSRYHISSNEPLWHHETSLTPSPAVPHGPRPSSPITGRPVRGSWKSPCRAPPGLRTVGNTDQNAKLVPRYLCGRCSETGKGFARCRKQIGPEGPWNVHVFSRVLSCMPPSWG